MRDGLGGNPADTALLVGLLHNRQPAQAAHQLHQAVEGGAAPSQTAPGVVVESGISEPAPGGRVGHLGHDLRQLTINLIMQGEEPPHACIGDYGNR